MPEAKEMRPHKGFQWAFASSNVDIVFGGGNLGGGKTTALIFALAEMFMLDGDFRALFSRKNLDNLKAAGGFMDSFHNIFGDWCEQRQADMPRVSFGSGAYCDLTYIDDSNLDKFRERAKGWQYDVIAIDEITEMSWEAFTYLQTRNRGISKMFTGHFFATLNPKRSHWTRVFLDWYIGPDGFIIPERDGCVRYLYINGPSVKDVVWGNSKEDVYRKCKIDIDRKLGVLGEGFSYENLIKSFVFYKGRLSENTTLMQSNPNYVGSVAAAGGRMAQALFEGNFNVDPDEEENVPIPSESARKCFTNDPAVNGDLWITVDLADVGTDNLVALAWNGLHVTDIMIITRSTPKANAARVKIFAQEHGVGDSHIIYDATAGRYFQDYIEDAVPYLSATRPEGKYQLTAASTKDLCYLRLCRVISNGMLTFAESVAERPYIHHNLNSIITVANEFMEECSVVRFNKMVSGKHRLLSKKEMNRNLGKGRSMDLLDPCAMRMLPFIDVEYGRELDAGFGRGEEESPIGVSMGTSIYDNIFAW